MDRCAINIAGLHGELHNFTDAKGRRNSSIHGYQKACTAPIGPDTDPCAPANETNVYTMSATQGWTCGNLISSPRDVATFFWELLGPPSTGDDPLLSAAMLEQMLSFKEAQYFDALSGVWGYGLGMMNFTSMNWGFADHGQFYGMC